MASAAIEDAGNAQYEPFRGQLLSSEYFWRDHQPWLEKRGYMLRARYMPDWKPSWEATSESYLDCEDGQPVRHPYILDATRLSDGRIVTLKRISKSLHPYEVAVGVFFSSEALRADPRNHCVPIYEVLDDTLDGDSQIIVMPFLKSCNRPRWQTVGEAVDFFHQVIEGVQFMHQHHTAHRDIMDLNVMMDPTPLYPVMYHFRDDERSRDWSRPVKHYSRTQRPTRYYFTDFGLSRKYNPADGPPRELPIEGGDKTVPEFQKEGYDMPWDPFPTDVYYLGSMIRRHFLLKYANVEFMRDLVVDMVQDDPKQRPTMDEVATRYHDIERRLHWWNCRARLDLRKDVPLVRGIKGLVHVFRTARYVVRGLPSVPIPPVC